MPLTSKIFPRLASTLVLILFPVLAASAQSATSQAKSSLRAARLDASLSIDGRLDEAAWRSAEPATGFRQSQPNEGASASQQTEVRILYGDANIYIGASLYDEAPDEIVDALGRRDEHNRADWFYVAIDSYFDRKTAYVFGVNAGGVQFDGLRSGDGGGPGRGIDESWDAVWESDVSLTNEGWFVETRIPYSMLRFSEADRQRWGIHFTREIPRLGEEVQWPLVPRAERTNTVAQFAVLEGMNGISPRRNIQVRPYTLSRLQTHEDEEVPGTMVRESNLDVGADLKVGITSGITLDATVNPDFGQVEVDPAVLNLTAFETFYQEKRPFFLEGSQIYEFSLDRRADLLYTRRIGAEAPIVGAAKLSGRTAGGTSIGVLGSATGDNLSPKRYYGVARVSQEIGTYSSAGGILTGFSGPDDDVQRRAVTGGADWDIRLADNVYGISGFGVFSTRGTLQEGFGGTGFAGQLQAARRQGDWRYDVNVTVFDDEFNANDIGLIRRNNYIDVGGGIQHEINGGQAFGPFQRASLYSFFGQEWSYAERLNTGFGFRLGTNWNLRSFQRIEVDVGANNLFGGYDLYETRGLWPWHAPTQYEFQVEYSTDDRRSWEIRPQVEINHYDVGGNSFSIGFRSDWNATARVNLSAEAAYGWDDNVVAWTANEDFLFHGNQWLIGHPDRPDGTRDPAHFVAFEGSEILDGVFGPEPFQSVPVFGDRDTRELDFTLRTSVTFNPDLSLQFYGQLLLARGRYENFRLLQDPDTMLPFDAYPKRDNFSFNSFTANTVLRWEYRPGSTLYLVWTQGRRAEDALNPLAPRGPSPYSRPLADQLGDTFSIFPENVFLVKLNYTFLR